LDEGKNTHSTTSVKYGTRSAGKSNQIKKKKSQRERKKKQNHFFFVNDMILYVEVPKHSTEIY
jgi:hypothetical protein